MPGKTLNDYPVHQILLTKTLKSEHHAQHGKALAICFTVVVVAARKTRN
jgi:hypothetical protein